MQFITTLGESVRCGEKLPKRNRLYAESNYSALILFPLSSTALLRCSRMLQRNNIMHFERIKFVSPFL